MYKHICFMMPTASDLLPLAFCLAPVAFCLVLLPVSSSVGRYGTVWYSMYSMYSMYRAYGRVCTDRTVCTYAGAYVCSYLVPGN